MPAVCYAAYSQSEVDLPGVQPSVYTFAYIQCAFQYWNGTYTDPQNVGDVFLDWVSRH